MKILTQRQISEDGRIWFRQINDEDGYPVYIRYEEDPYYDLVAPNPPTPEAIKRAQFVDKTYQWAGK